MVGIVIFCNMLKINIATQELSASSKKLQLEQNITYSINREEMKMLKRNIKIKKL